jgi:hypothetical protein
MNDVSHDASVLVRIHLADGSLESFVRDDPAQAHPTLQGFDPARLFAQPRLVIAGTHSKSVFVPSEITRIDFIGSDLRSCKFPEGYSDIVELCEAEFRNLAHLDDPGRMSKRERSTSEGDLMVSFLKLQFKSGLRVFLMTERSARLPSENQPFMRLLLSRNPFAMRLRSGGVAFLNLANLLGYTVYPGSPQVPSDSWIAEPTSCKPLDCVNRSQTLNE